MRTLILLGLMSANGYKIKEADMYRLYGTCGHCKQNKFFLSRVVVKLPSGNKTISPSHFCRKCRVLITSMLQ